MKRHTYLPALLLAALGSALLPAAAAQDKEETTWYTVEMIVFERVSEAGRSAELWPADPGLPDIAGAVELSAAGLEPPSPTTAAQNEGLAGTVLASPARVAQAALGVRPFQLVPPKEYRLENAWRRLEKSGAYRPLLHVSWIQPGYPADSARLVHVRNNNSALGAGGSGSDGAPAQSLNEPGYAPTLSSRVRVARDPSKAALDGTVKLHRARYLHFQVDLLYYRPLPSDARADADAGANAELLPNSPDAALIERLMAETDAAPRLFRLKESRRMRSGELHYLDHPLFGVLVEIWPLQLPEAVPALPEAPEPADTGSQGKGSGAGEPPAVLPAPATGGSGG